MCQYLQELLKNKRREIETILRDNIQICKFYREKYLIDKMGVHSNIRILSAIDSPTD